ncbi:MAG TPA: cbb3-type cytochrome c oxidase subunit I [Puia sp.]|nr:cbb3-type cytochrome c oxidase subunit I [Puia sp.]
MDIKLIPEPNEAIPSMSVETDQGILQWISSVDHKQIGILYLWVSVLFLLVGGIEILLVRVQLFVPGNHFLAPETFDQLFTMHGTTMIFFVLTPAIFGFATYFVPLMIGANDMAFPRLNAFSFWVTFFGGGLLYFSFIAGGAPDAGWFNYAPLNQYNYSSSQGIDYYCSGLLLSGIGTVTVSVNFIVTILRYRVKSMRLQQLPLFVWMILINSFLVLAAFPSLNAALAMLLLDRQLHAHFFTVAGGGSAILWQHLFWLFGHPEVYILILPIFGIFSEVFPVFSRKPIFGYGIVVGSGIAIALLAFGVWVHHMFATGLGNTVNGFFAASSLLIGVPTGVKIFNWLATMHKGSIRFSVPMLFAIAFLIEFTIGGLSGISFAIVPIDWQLTDTYYVVAHLHFVFIGGSLFGLFSALFYWLPKISGRLPDERLSRLFFWLFIVGFNLTFLVQHALGMMGMPRRVYTYPGLPGWAILNQISTVGGFLMAIAVGLLVYILVRTIRAGAPAPADPWDGNTLEWTTAAPPALKNFDRVIPVRSTRPFRDYKRPEDADPPSVEKAGSISPLRRGAGSDNNLMMKLVVGTEAMFFICLIMAYVYFSFVPGFHGAPGRELDTRSTLLFSLLLFSSSFTYWRAERNGGLGKERRMRVWLLMTIVLGLIFLLGQGREYAHLLHGNVTVSSSLFGTGFFTLTGFHGFHVLVGLLLIIIVTAFSFSSRPGSPNSRRGGAPVSAVRTIGIYWHFVDMVWLFVFLVVYVSPHFF